MRYILILILTVCSFVASAQKILEIDIVKFNRFKPIQLHNGSYIEYKLKGAHKYRINKMVNMKDSLIIFDNDSSIALSEIKVIKLRDANHLYRLFSRFFYTGGLLFVGLDTLNNFINKDSPLVNQTAVIVSAALISAGFITKQLSIKRVRINNHQSLRIIDTDYQNLNK
jgi:hypothetical protein